MTATTYSQMIDLAITFPEIGAVNFNLLKSFLHALLKQLQLNDAYVEYDLPEEKPQPEILQGKYPAIRAKINKDGKETSKKHSIGLAEMDKEVKFLKGKQSNKESDVKKKINRQKHKIEERDADSDTSDDAKKDADSDSSEDANREAGSDSSEDVRSGQESGVLVLNADSFDNLKNKVSELTAKMKLVETLSSNKELLNRSKEPTATPFSDIWNIMNLGKRMDACEEGLARFASAIEELAKETARNEKKIDEIIRTLNMHNIHIDKESEKAKSVSKDKEEDVGTLHIDDINIPSIQNVDKKMKEMLQNINEMKGEILDLSTQQKYLLSLTETLPIESFSDVLMDISELKSKMEQISTAAQENAKITDPEKTSQLETQLEDHIGKLNELRLDYNNQMDSFQEQIKDLEKELANILERLNTSGSFGGVTDMATLDELYLKLQSLQTEMENLRETATKLMIDQEERQSHINGLLEQVEIMKVLKADKEALEDALAEKADALAVNRKVSHDQFDAAYNDLHQSIIEAQERLSHQENEWIAAISDIYKEIGSKMDQIEIKPVQDIIDNKIKTIEEHIKAISKRKIEEEASGTKNKFLRNVNCISCDKSVVMRKELDGPLLPKQEALPPTRSMRPYLTYELDHVRRQEKRPPIHNLIHFENAIVEQKLKTNEAGSTQMNRHLCSRYCGGSHTTITNQQRVCRVGHFPDFGAKGESKQGLLGTDINVYLAKTQETKMPKSKE